MILITEIGLDYFRELPYAKPCNNYLLFLCAIFYFEHVIAIMSGNCAINFHRYHCNKILVVFRCFGAIEKLYLFLSLSGIFTGPLRVFLGNMGVFLGILWYSWVNVWTVENPYWTSVLSNTGFQYNTDSSPIRVFNTIQIHTIYFHIVHNTV